MFVNVVTDVVLSTAHKAKGLEFDTVQLTDDYLSPDSGMFKFMLMLIAFCGRLKVIFVLYATTSVTSTLPNRSRSTLLCNLLDLKSFNQLLHYCYILQTCDQIKGARV